MYRSFFAALIIALSPLVAEPVAAQVDMDRAILGSYLDALARNNRIMGSVVIAKAGEPVYTKVFGHRDVERGTVVRSDDATMFRIGSIGKVFTAAMIFRLIESDRLSLDAPVARFFEQVPNAQAITIRHLLSHTSGLPRDVRYDDGTKRLMRVADKDQFLLALSKATTSFVPGSRRQYSNVNFILLGYIAEQITGRRYGELLRQWISDTVGMTRTRVGDTVRTLDNEARSYSWDSGKWIVHAEEHLSHAAGAGAIVSTGRDLARFAYHLFATEEILNKKSLATMTAPMVQDVANSTGGIAVGEVEVGPHRKLVYQHDGGVDGFRSLLTYFPEDSVTISVILNGVNYPLARVFRAAARSYYGQPLEVPSFDVIRLPNDVLESFAGRFSCAQTGMSVDVRPEGQGLRVQVRGQDPFELQAVGSTVFTHTESGIIIEFAREPNGRVAGFELHQRGGALSCARIPPR